MNDNYQYSVTGWHTNHRERNYITTLTWKSFTEWSVLHEHRKRFNWCSALLETDSAPFPCWQPLSWPTEFIWWCFTSPTGLHWSRLTVEVWAREGGKERRGDQQVGEPALIDVVGRQLYSDIAPLSSPTASKYLHDEYWYMQLWSYVCLYVFIVSIYIHYQGFIDPKLKGSI